MSNSITEDAELQSLREEVNKCMKEVHEFGEKIDERNQKRIQLIQELSELLPPEQFKRFEDILKKTNEAVQPLPDPGNLKPIPIDEENPLESLRKVRCQIAQEVCTVMGVEAPTL